MSDKADLLWGGRFKSGPSEALTKLSRSPEYYFDLAPYDIAGSKAHAHELERAGLLLQSETEKMVETLEQIDLEYRAGTLKAKWGDEDVHTFIERELTERLGDLGGKLRAGRSRNDQTANDLKLYLRDQSRKVLAQLLLLQDALVQQAAKHTETIAPGFTHLQQAQPIVFGHQLMAHVQAFARDISRLQDWDERTAYCPLGAAAMAGSAIALHPELSAKELGYTAPCENSIDAVASRDHVAEFLFVTGMLSVHLSRLCEEVCLWASRQFRWVNIHDSYSTGSSIMPQKKNPDIAELTRGRSGRLIGNLMGLMTTLKAMPLSYNRDLSEDKRHAIDSVETLLTILPAMSGMIATMEVNVDELRSQAPEGFTLATEVADWLAKSGVPFKVAHEITGNLVKYCEEKNLQLWEVDDQELIRIDERLNGDVKSVLTLEAAIKLRSATGGTAPEQVQKQIQNMKVVIESQKNWCEAYAGLRV